MSRLKRKIPRSQWLPALLLCYLAAMNIYFGGDLIRRGEIFRLVVVSVVELLLIAALYFFLKKREKSRQ